MKVTPELSSTHVPTFMLAQIRYMLLVLLYRPPRKDMLSNVLAVELAGKTDYCMGHRECTRYHPHKLPIELARPLQTSLAGDNSR